MSFISESQAASMAARSPYRRRNISFFLVPPAPSAQDGIQDAMESLFPCAGQTFGADRDLRYFGDPVSGMYMEHYYGSQNQPPPPQYDPANFPDLSKMLPGMLPPQGFVSPVDPGPPPADWETCLAREIIVIPDVESDGWIVTLMGTSMNKSVIYAKIGMIGLGGVSELTEVQQNSVGQYLREQTMERMRGTETKQPRTRLPAPVATIVQDPRMGTLLPVALAAFAGYLLARRGAARNNLI
jgi:hypothetical protein